MPDPQQIVERIRAFMASTDETRTPELAEVAETYATLCAETNARLRRCRDYLRRGLRAEAIHEADEPPSLLDLVALLDIPEATDWARTCGAYQLQRPPPLLIEAGQELNDAYAAAQPLRSLLEKHRKLALLRAPLNQRIAVMRELAQTDTATPFWTEDVEAFEHARLRELNVEASTAAKAGDRGAIVKLRDEINTTQWTISVPPELRAVLDRTENTFARKDAEQQVRDLLPELNVAYSAMDYDAASALMRQIRHLISETQLALPNELAAQIIPVRDWLNVERQHREQQAQFEAACEQLKLAISADAPSSELERLKGAALLLGDALPADLSKQFREKQQQRAAAAARVARRSAVIIAAMALVCLLVMGLVVRTILRDRKTRAAYETLSPLIGAEKWDEAKKQFDDLARDFPSALERPDFQALRTQMDNANAREQDRRDAFARQMKHVLAAGLNNPDTTALTEAESLAKTPEEKAQLSDFRGKLDASRRDARQKELDALKQQVASLGVQTDWLENEARQNRLSPTNATLNDTQTAVAKITGSAALPADLKKDAESLAQRLKALHDNVMRLSAEHESLSLLLASTGSATSLHDALAAYVLKNPDSPRAAGFTQAAGDAAKWEAVEQAAQLIETWQGKLQPADALLLKRADALAAFTAKFPDSPFTATFDDYNKYLQANQRALAPDGPWKSDLATLLATPILKEMRCLRTTDGRVYYLLADANPQTNSLGTSFNAVMSGDIGSVKKIQLKPAQLASTRPSESPQSLLAAELSKKLAGLDESNWETFGLDVIDTTLVHKDIDPVLRVILLSRFAKLAQTGTWGAGDAIGALDTIVAALNADDIAWMNPTDAAANEARGKANVILAGLSPLKEIRGTITARRAALFKLLQFRIAGRGVLLHDGDSWNAGPLSKCQPGQEAWVVVTENKTSTMQKIGEAGSDGKLVIDAAMLRNVPEGEMVFLVDKK